MNGVGRAAIPILLRGAHLRRNGNDEVVLQQSADFPAFAKMLQERLALELSQDVDGKNSRIDQVAQDEINNPVTSAEWNSRFRAFLGQRIKACPFTAGQNKCQHSKLHLVLRGPKELYTAEDSRV